jgi:hypothetical protein
MPLRSRRGGGGGDIINCLIKIPSSSATSEHETIKLNDLGSVQPEPLLLSLFARLLGVYKKKMHEPTSCSAQCHLNVYH